MLVHITAENNCCEYQGNKAYFFIMLTLFILVDHTIHIDTFSVE